MKFPWEEEAMTPVQVVDRAITSRKSIRAFLPYAAGGWRAG